MDKRPRGHPITDPFYDQRKNGVANTYTKNIPLADWERFQTFCLSRGWTKRWAIIRCIQELPDSDAMQAIIGGLKR